MGSTFSQVKALKREEKSKGSYKKRFQKKKRKKSEIGRFLPSTETFLSFKCTDFKTQLCHLLAE